MVGGNFFFCANLKLRLVFMDIDFFSNIRGHCAQRLAEIQNVWLVQWSVSPCLPTSPGSAGTLISSLPAGKLSRWCASLRIQIALRLRRLITRISPALAARWRIGRTSRLSFWCNIAGTRYVCLGPTVWREGGGANLAQSVLLREVFGVAFVFWFSFSSGTLPFTILK